MWYSYFFKNQNILLLLKTVINKNKFIDTESRLVLTRGGKKEGQRKDKGG